MTRAQTPSRSDSVATISVVVPTHRRAQTLKGTLAALLAIDYPSSAYEVIVVDDGMDDSTAALVESLRGGPVRVELVRQNGLGAATARNQGAHLASGEVLLFLDDDMVVAPDHLRMHLAARQAYGNVLVGSDRWYSPDSLAAFEATPFGRYRIALERGFMSGRREHELSGSIVETTTLASCDLSIARDTFWDLGGFDESFPYAGAEDQDLSTRARRAGLRLIRDYAIQPLHQDPTTTLSEFSLREERGAHTVMALCRKFPEYLGDFHENGPIAVGDRPRVVLKKLAKSVLSQARPLSALHALVDWLEQWPLPDRALWRAYQLVIGLHIFRGFRDAVRAERTRG